MGRAETGFPPELPAHGHGGHSSHSGGALRGWTGGKCPHSARWLHPTTAQTGGEESLPRMLRIGMFFRMLAKLLVMGEGKRRRRKHAFCTPQAFVTEKAMSMVGPLQSQWPLATGGSCPVQLGPRRGPWVVLPAGAGGKVEREEETRTKE